MLSIKFSKKQVEFEHPANGKDRCSDCEYFKSPDGCKIVEGLIRPGDWCNKFKEKNMAEAKKKKHAGHGFTHTHIEHHGDGSHTVHHVHEEGPHKDVKHAAMDMDAVHDSMQDHMGMPNPGEAEAEAGPAMPPGAPGGAPPAPGM